MPAAGARGLPPGAPGLLAPGQLNEACGDPRACPNRGHSGGLVYRTPEEAVSSDLGACGGAPDCSIPRLRGVGAASSHSWSAPPGELPGHRPGPTVPPSLAPGAHAVALSAGARTLGSEGYLPMPSRRRESLARWSVGPLPAPNV